MFANEKIYAVYEKPEASDPAERVMLVREGFAFWAFALHAFWLLSKRMWLPLLAYCALAIGWRLLAQALDISMLSAALVQVWLQLMLGYHAHDLQGWLLKRQGYRFAGLLVAESEMAAARRYYEYAA